MASWRGLLGWFTGRRLLGGWLLRGRALCRTTPGRFLLLRLLVLVLALLIGVLGLALLIGVLVLGLLLGVLPLGLLLSLFVRPFEQGLGALLEGVGDGFEASVRRCRQRCAPGIQHLTPRLLDQRRHRRIVRQFACAQDDGVPGIERKLLAHHEGSDAEGQLPLLGPAKDIARRHGSGESDLLTVFHECLETRGRRVAGLFRPWERRYRTHWPQPPLSSSSPSSSDVLYRPTEGWSCHVAFRRCRSCLGACCD